MHRKSSRQRRAADPNAPVRAIIYTRLSKAKDSRENTDVGLDTQRAGCERAITALCGTIVDVEQDVISGDRLDRPGLWRAIDRIKAGDANTLIVYSIDRLGRDGAQQGVIVVELKRAGGQLLSATENLEVGPFGDLMRTVYTLTGALELQKIRERTTRGLTAKFKQTGSYKPGHRPPYGYSKLGTGAGAAYVVNDSEARIVERIFTERAAGQSLRAIVAGLNADRVPSPTGRETWVWAAVDGILNRRTYWTGQHECWRYRIERNADGIPFAAERPVDERYTVPFPILVSADLASRAQATKARNVYRSRRDDRPAEYGLLRYGFAVCAGCGRRLSLCPEAGKHARYRCKNTGQGRKLCPEPTNITVGLIDEPVWAWVSSIIEAPERAANWQLVRQTAPLDPAVRKALADGENAIAEAEQQMNGLITNLGLLTGAAATIAAERINALSAQIDATRASQDRLAAAATDTGPVYEVVSTDVITTAINDAIGAMLRADPSPATTQRVGLQTTGGIVPVHVPTSWKARQAAPATLNVVVTVAAEKSGQPRWVADIRLPRGETVRGSSRDSLRETEKVSSTPWNTGSGTTGPASRRTPRRGTNGASSTPRCATPSSPKQGSRRSSTLSR